MASCDILWCFANSANDIGVSVWKFECIIKLCSIDSRNDPSPKGEVVCDKVELEISYKTYVS